MISLRRSTLTRKSKMYNHSKVFPKVDYRTAYGGHSTAYLDHDIDETTTTAYGTNKHTDEPVILTWSEEMDMWIEEDPSV